jgi:hypothetical protein
MALIKPQYTPQKTTNPSKSTSFTQRVVDTPIEGIPVNGSNNLDVGISWYKKGFYYKEGKGDDLKQITLNFPALSNSYHNTNQDLLVPIVT